MKIKVTFNQPNNIVQLQLDEPAKYRMIGRKFMLSEDWVAWETMPSRNRQLVAINFYEPVGMNKVRVFMPGIAGGPTTKLCDVGETYDAELIDHANCIVL